MSQIQSQEPVLFLPPHQWSLINEYTFPYTFFSSLLQTRMQSLQPDPKAQYSSVFEALKKIIRTEGFWRPLRGINVTMLGAGPAHALYFACYERMKRTLSDIIHDGGNSHLANGILTAPRVHSPPFAHCVLFLRSDIFGLHFWLLRKRLWEKTILGNLGFSFPTGTCNV